MKKTNLLIIDEVNKPVAVIQINKCITEDVDEFLSTLDRNKQFIPLFLKAIKEDLAEDDVSYDLGDFEYFSFECITRINVYQVYEDEQKTNTLSFYVHLIEIYS